MDLFEKQWASYRAVVEHDLMEHQAVANATAAALEGWLARRPAKTPPRPNWWTWAAATWPC